MASFIIISPGCIFSRPILAAPGAASIGLELLRRPSGSSTILPTFHGLIRLPTASLFLSISLSRAITLTGANPLIAVLVRSQRLRRLPRLPPFQGNLPINAACLRVVNPFRNDGFSYFIRFISVSPSLRRSSPAEMNNSSSTVFWVYFIREIG